MIAQVEVSEERTIHSTTFDENPVAEFLPPPSASRGDSVGSQSFTPFEVAPLLSNQRQVEDALRREYPTTLRDAGIGGVVQVVFAIDAQGKVLSTGIATSSGHPRLDEAALRVADLMEFSPAMNRDVAVPVRVTFPIRFSVREPAPSPPSTMG